jgi:hypothetical protein
MALGLTLAALVISLLTRPHPPRFNTIRRKMLSVTPAIGTSVTFGLIVSPPTW